MSLGAHAIGINIVLAVEADRHAAITYRQNHRDVEVFDCDIRALTSRRIKAIPRGDHETIVFGGPPCQGFSYSNQRTRKSGNPDNWLFLEFLRVVKAWEPDWVIFENVKGLANTADGMFLDEVLTKLGRLKYRCKTSLLDSADFGVPQHRGRLFIIGRRGAGRVPDIYASHRHHITVDEAIGDLPELGNGADENWREYGSATPSRYAQKLRGHLSKSSGHIVTRNAPYVVERYKHIPQGGNWTNIPLRLMKNYANREGCHTGIYHRLTLNKPSIVIGNYRKNMLIHPLADRGLSVREAARIQSFPDWYEFKGSVGFQQQQVANAVPPLLASAVFKSIGTCA